MAKAEPKQAPEGEQAPKKKGKLIIIIAAVVLLLGALGGGAWYVLHPAEHEDDEEAAAEAPKKKSGKETPPVYVALEAFTVNLVPDPAEQYLQVAMSLELEDAAEGEKIKLHMPKLRNKVMLLLSSKKGPELVTKEGKEGLAQELKQQMNEVLAPSGKDKNGPIKEVLFTSFIIQ